MGCGDLWTKWPKIFVSIHPYFGRLGTADPTMKRDSGALKDTLITAMKEHIKHPKIPMIGSQGWAIDLRTTSINEYKELHEPSSRQ